MSNNVVQSHDSDGMSGKSINPNQSSWMAHWMQTNYKSSPQTSDHLSLRYKPKEDGHGNKQHSLPGEREISSAISKPGIGFREVADPVKILNESRSADNSKKESIDCHSFPMCNFSQNRESILGSKINQPSICSKKVSTSPVGHNSRYNTVTLALGTNESLFPSLTLLDPSETENSLRRCHVQPEGTSENFGQLVNYQCSLEKNRFAASRSFQGDLMGSTSNVVHGFSSEKSPVQSSMCRPEQINPLDSRLPLKEHFRDTTVTHLEHEHKNYHNFSAFLVRGENSNSHKSLTSATSLLRQNDLDLLLHDPSTSNYQVPDLIGEPYQKIQQHPDIRFFPSQSSLRDVNKSENFNHVCYSQQVRPFSVHDVEAMRVCTTVDSVGGITGGPPKYSQTTRHMLITTKTGINLSEGGQMFKESASSKKFIGKTFNELPTLSPDFGNHDRPGLKLQPLDSSTDSEGNEKMGDVKTSADDSKNESSAETDTMDMDAFKENYHLTNLALSVSNKGVENVSSSQPKLSSNSEEVRGKLLRTELPDINEEPPAQFSAASPMGYGEPSTSRTQSLDVDHLLSNAGNPANFKSILSPVGTLGQNPSSRWVKRLKMSPPGSFAHGTKSAKMGEAASHEKVNKFFQNLKGSITSNEPTSDTHRGREQMKLNQTATLLKNDESSPADSVKKGENITLSHSWVRRWCRSEVVSPQEKSKAVVIYEPQSSKAAFEDFQKEQFPSIAAMALMGKAMNGFGPCEFRKRGSFVVWNTKEL